MSGMAKHSDAGTPLRRAHFAAWAVFLGMAGTSMTFQVYHAVTAGDMAWELAALYGTAPLAISIGVLEFTAAWRNLWAQLAAYAIAIGAMYESASATGAVTAHAGPSHAELVFGLILDAAALLAIAFIANGPTAAQAVAAVIRREAELLGAARAERAAREEAERTAAATEASLRVQLAEEQAAAGTAAAQAQEALRAAALRAEEGAQAAVRAALEAAGEAHRARENALLQEGAAERHAREIAEQGASRWSAAEDARIAAEAGRASNADQLRSARDALEAANAARREAEARAEQAEAKAAALARRAGTAAGAKGTRSAGSAAGGGAPATKVPKDFDAQAAALAILAEEPDISGAKLGERVGRSERWGQDFKKQLATRPAGGAGQGPGEGE
jgi:hypothetical protein